MSSETEALFPCYCHGEDLVPYCPRHTPLPGEEARSADAGEAGDTEALRADRDEGWRQHNRSEIARLAAEARVAQLEAERDAAFKALAALRDGGASG